MFDSEQLTLFVWEDLPESAVGRGEDPGVGERARTMSKNETFVQGVDVMIRAQLTGPVDA